MADQILQPTSNTTPDPGQGGSAVSTPTNTGHGSTIVSSSGTNLKTCLWTIFQLPASTPSKIKIKASFSQNGTVTGPNAGNDFLIEYSLNGGGSWNVLHSASDITSSSSGTVEAVLTATQDISQVRVRDNLSAFLLNGDSASLTASVSDIQLEVDFGTNRMVLLVT